MRLLKAQNTNLRNIKGRGVKYDTNGEVDIDSNRSVRIPRGPTIDRPNDPRGGEFRYNTTNDKFEFYENNQWRNGSSDYAKNVYYVSKSGSDSNTGTTLSDAFLTIDYALTQIPIGSTLYVKSGDYTLNNPVTVPEFVAIVGDSLRTVSVRAGNPNLDMFYVNNGSYLTHITFKDHESPSAAVCFNPDGSAGEIFTSPYVQNCTSMTTTGTGMRVDGRHAQGLKSMVVDAFTQYNQGGIGIHMLYEGNTQLVSVFTICCEVAILCENGGFCSLTNSNSSFGTYALKADGVSDSKYEASLAQSTNPEVTRAGSTIYINDLTTRPKIGDAISFGSEPTYYTISTASDLKLGSTALSGPNFNTEPNDARSTRTAILSAKSKLQVDTIDFINETFTNFTYNEEKCSRDIGYLLDAVALDLVLGTNYNSITAGLSYQRANASLVKNNQFHQTKSSINYVKDKIDALGLSATGESRALANLTEVIDIFENNTPDSLTFPAPVGVSQDLIDAKDQLQANRTFIRAEIVAYINDKYNSLVYDETKCSRDVGYIVDALSHDILYGGNSAVRRVAQSYFVGVAGQLGTGETQATVDAYNYLEVIVDSIVRGELITKTTGNGETQDTSSGNATTSEGDTLAGLISVITEVIAKDDVNEVEDEILPVITWATAGLQTDYSTVISAKTSIQTDTISYINTRFVDFNYNQKKCSRDIGLILEAVADDMVFGTNYKSILAGKSYYRQSASAVISDQLIETVAALEFLKTETLKVISSDSSIEQSEYTSVSDNFDIVINILENGTGSAPSINYASPSILDNDLRNAADSLQANRDFIIEEGIAYIAANYPSLTYDQTACRRDIGFIVDAITYDILYGGNSQTFDAADEYYSGGVLQISLSEKQATIDTYTYIQSIVGDVVVDGYIGALNITESQVTGTPASSTQSNDVAELAGFVVELLTNGYTSEVTLDEDIDGLVPAGTSMTFHQYSLITASGHTFEWVGAGTNVNEALPYAGGRPLVENYVIQENGGRVYYTGTDQEGDFRIGNDLTINRTTGTIEGDTFDRSLFAVLTPYILAIED